jgi:MFS transporter, Spinster family, sphingosine-1-phosphate transporter
VPLSDLLRIPAYVAALVAGCFITFAGYSFIFWGTSFVHSVKGFALEEAGLVLGANMIVAGVLGIVVGATLADRMARVVVWGRVLVITVGLLLGVPFLFWALHTPAKAHFIVFFFLGGFFMSWYHGPLTAVLHDLTPERAHATAMGLYQGVVHLVAVTSAPIVIGRVADRWGLLRGMDVAAGFYVVGALCFFVVLLLVRRHGAVPRPALSHAPDVAVPSPVTAADARPSGSVS